MALDVGGKTACSTERWCPRNRPRETVDRRRHGPRARLRRPAIVRRIEPDRFAVPIRQFGTPASSRHENDDRSASSRRRVRIRTKCRHSHADRVTCCRRHASEAARRRGHDPTRPDFARPAGVSLAGSPTCRGHRRGRGPCIHEGHGPGSARDPIPHPCQRPDGRGRREEIPISAARKNGRAVEAWVSVSLEVRLAE